MAITSVSSSARRTWQAAGGAVRGPAGLRTRRVAAFATCMHMHDVCVRLQACGCRHAAAGMRLQAHRLGAVRRHRRRRGQAATDVRGRLGDAQPGRLLLQRLPQQRLRARRPHSMRRHDMPRTLVGLHGRRQPWHGQRRLRPSLPCPRAAHRRGRGGAGSAGGTDGSALALQMLVDQRARWRQRWPRVVSSVSSLR